MGPMQEPGPWPFRADNFGPWAVRGPWRLKANILEGLAEGRLNGVLGAKPLNTSHPIMSSVH